MPLRVVIWRDNVKSFVPLRAVTKDQQCLIQVFVDYDMVQELVVNLSLDPARLMNPMT